MQPLVRTVYGAQLQTCQYMRLPFSLLDNTTLNQKFNIHAEVALTPTELPKLAYIGIGNGGHRVTVGADSVPLIEVVEHLPDHAALYNQLPFVLRLLDDDLSAQDRAQYRLRRIEYHDGTPYIAYYLKCLDLSETVSQMELISVINGVSQSTPFVPSNSNLNPTPPALTPDGVNLTTGDYIFASAKVPFLFTEADVAEFTNVANVLYGDTNYAIISEIALCSGVDRVVSGTFNGATAAYTDAIAVQVMNFIAAFYSMTFNNTGIDMLLSVGSVEPLLTLSPGV